MRENRTYGSEGGEPGNGSLPYPYRNLLELRKAPLRNGWSFGKLHYENLFRTGHNPISYRHDAVTLWSQK